MTRSACRYTRPLVQRESGIPWPGYLLWVGTALVLLLFAVDAATLQTASNRPTNTEVHFPPIRIYSEMKGPEAVVIDTTSETASVQVGSPVSDSNAAVDQSTAPPFRQAASDGSPSASSRDAGETFAQLVALDRTTMRKPKTHRSLLRVRRANAQLHVATPRQHNRRFRHFVCERCVVRLPAITMNEPAFGTGPC